MIINTLRVQGFRIIMLLLLLPINTYATKQYKIDSLLHSYPDNPNDRVDNYIRISYYYKTRSPEMHKAYLDSATKILSNVTEENLISSYYTSYGHYFYKLEKFDSCKIMYKNSLSYVDTINGKYLAGKVYNNLGRLFARVDQYDSALYYYQKTIVLFNKKDTAHFPIKIDILIANTYNKIGSVYLNMGNYDESVTFFYKSLEIYDKYDNKLRNITVLINIGNIYLFHSEFNKALVEYKKAHVILMNHKGRRRGFLASVLTNMGVCYKAMGQRDTAMTFFGNALEIRNKIGPKSSIAGLYDNIGSIKKSQGNYAEALNYYQRALEIRKGIKRPRWLASSYGSIGLLYAEQGKSKLAIGYLKKAIDIADQNSLVEISMECKRGMSQAYQGLGDYKKALAYFVEYRELNDSIHSLRLEEKLNEYKQKYESEKKDRIIEHLEETQKLADLEAEKQKIVNDKQSLVVKALSFAALLLLVILFILHRYFKMKRASDRELFEKNEQINHQKTLKLMKDLEMSSIKSFVEGQEKERARIAADLHDRLGTLLSTVRLHFNSLEEVLNQDADAQQSYEFAMQLLDKSVGEVRAVSHNLSKGVLTQFGLIAAVENMRDAINSAGKIQMQVMNYDVVSRLDPDSEINLFRVIQELITNVIRHAQTNEVIVQFSGGNTNLSVMVEDHGIGFDPKNVKSDGIGMTNLRKRISDINGEMTIESIIGQGTTIVIDVPYKVVSEKAKDAKIANSDEKDNS